MRWAAWHSGLNAPAEDGSSQRAHLEVAAKYGHPEAIQKLTGPDFPDALSYLWDWSEELAACRRMVMTGMGTASPDPITYTDIDAWARLTDRQPFPHEVQALLALDRVRCFPQAVTSERE